MTPFHLAFHVRDLEETRRFGRSPTLEFKDFASMEQGFAH